MVENDAIESTLEANNKSEEAKIAAVNASPDKTYECVNNFTSTLDGLEFDVPSWNGRVIYVRNGDYIEGKLLNDNVQQHFKLQPTGISGITKNPLIYTGNADRYDMIYQSDKEHQPKIYSDTEYTLNLDDEKFMYNELPDDSTVTKCLLVFLRYYRPIF